jgi:hypothetical protein
MIIHYQKPSLETNHLRFNLFLDGIDLWCGKDDMLLNIKKCKELLVCFWKNKPNVPLLKLNNHLIEVVQSAKLLGVILNDHLKWNEHVVKLLKKH